MKGHKTLALLALVFVLGGCTMVSKAYLNEAIDKAKELKEGEARLLLTTVCAMGIGAMYRELDAAERGHVEGLCGGEKREPTITFGALQMLGLIR